MESQFRALADVNEIAGTDLTFAHAKEIYDAVRLNRDFDLIGVFRGRATPETIVGEIVIVDVSCDGIPPTNAAGIAFTERLALCVPEDPSSLVEVLALRMGFPLLMHQNAVLPDRPPSLCLYQEPARSVTRTWTAASFLKRIQFWLEGSARETLHAADQPVEQLFFASPYELVLPWNFDSLLASGKSKFWVARGVGQVDRGGTFFLEGGSEHGKERTASLVSLTLPAVVHGRVETDFGTLGQLFDALSARGVDLLSELKSEIEARVGSGIQINQDEPASVLLMCMPIVRDEGAPPSKIIHRAYILNIGMLKLGVMMGSICDGHDGKYYKEVKAEFIQPQEKIEWRSQAILPMEVLQSLDRTAARYQSGLASEGPAAGVIVGAGALGSAMLDMWTRAGWGEWSIIDNDHIKPHNLVRHQADSSLIGVSKAEAAAYHVRCVMLDATKAVAIPADACDLGDAKVLEVLCASKLVVDASTTLDYPRLISTRDDVGRHISVFVTPSGRDGVLLLEDFERTKRLRTLEAQYYRSVLNSDWGTEHLEGNRGTFWSGASCRDISMVMPYANIVRHAAVFVDQVPRLSQLPGAAIRVWSCDAESGAVSAHQVQVFDELRLNFGELDLFIDAGVYDKMNLLRTNQLPNETGGILLGYYDFNVNAVIVVDAMPAPTDSKASPDSFERGIKGVADAVVEVRRRTAGVVGYIGEWHSHPQGYSAHPSDDDKFQLAYLTLGLASEGLPAVMLIVGDNDLYALQGIAK